MSVKEKKSSVNKSLTPIEQLQAVIDGHHGEPHNVLGAHPAKIENKSGVIVRCFVQDAQSVEVLVFSLGEEPGRFPMKEADPSGFFHVFIPTDTPIDQFSYRLSVHQQSTVTREFFDPYAFLPQPCSLVNK